MRTLFFSKRTKSNLKKGPGFFQINEPFSQTLYTDRCSQSNCECKKSHTCNKICSCILITTCVTINFVRRLYNNQLLESPKESLFKPAILVSAGLGWRLCLLQVAITPQKHKLYQSREKRFD